MKCKWYLCEKESSVKGVYCSRACSNKSAVTRKRQKLKRQAIEYKDGKCEDCGYSKCDKALQFHHLDSKEKDFGISSGETRSWEKIKIELDKCVLICANCHAERHDREYKDVAGSSLEAVILTPNYYYKLNIINWKENNKFQRNESAYVPQFIRRYLFLKFNNACCKCGWSKVHPVNNKIPLQIDHINGDACDNREENLQLLCPNCHSLTSTYGSLNRGNGRESRRIWRNGRK